MRVNLRQIQGPWNDGWVLDKHTVRSVPVGENEYGHMQFETERTEVGEASFLLKYRNELGQVPALARCLSQHVIPRLGSVDVIVPMPATTQRAVQPVYSLSSELSRICNLVCLPNLLHKVPNGRSLKDLNGFDEKIAAIGDSLSVSPVLTGARTYNILLVDDLYHTGASMYAACNALRKYNRIGEIYVAALTWR